MPDQNALTGAEIDRAADRRRRDDAWLAEQAAHPGARIMVLGDAGARADGDVVALLPIADLDRSLASEPVLLGLDGAGPVWAIDEDAPRDGKRARLIGAGGTRGEPAPQAQGRIGLRDAAQTLPQAQGALVAYAASVLNWHRSHRFCGVCSGATISGEAGMVRNCERCGTHHHPRTDPVVIMLVVDEHGDRVLLGRQSTWPPWRYSALAGFVSPGESLEEGVAREVFEEAGVVVGQPVYRSSQPWPFPYSLMLGFHVPYLSGAIGGTDDELEDARWFSRAEVEHANGLEDSWDEPSSGTGLLLPPRSAIARRLIDAWLAADAA